MVFSRALPDDLPELVSLYRLAARRMEAKGIFQWDDIYPDSHVISRDIERGEMRMRRIGAQIAVAFSLESCVSGQYEQAHWRYDEPRFLVLHRLCVHPSHQGCGMAREAMDFVERAALERGIFARIRPTCFLKPRRAPSL
ncbi:MAG: GNAT family N-acetyltransferase [Eubacteriales bacterium]